MQKKIIYMLLGLIIIVIIIIFLLKDSEKKVIEINDEYIGVIENTQKGNKSYIHYYDKDFNYKESVCLPIGNFGSVDCKTIENKKNIYVLSNDTSDKNSNSKVINIDKETGVYNVHIKNKFINDMSTGKNLYTVNTKYEGKNISYIDMISSNKEKQYTLKLEDIIISKIYIKDNKLFAVGFDYNQGIIESKLYIIDAKLMKVIKSMNISEYVVDVIDMIFYKNKLYIAGRTRRDRNKDEIDNKYLIKVDIDNNNFEKIYIGHKLGQLIIDKEKMYISSYDSVIDEGDYLTVLDLHTFKKRQIQVLDKIRDMIISNNKLYILGAKSILSYNAYDNLKIVKKMKLKNKFKKDISVSTCFFRKMV